MIFILLLYYVLYIIFIFGLIPLNALFYIKPLFIIIIIVLFYSAAKYLKKIYLKIFLLLLNIVFFLILKEFSNVSYKTTLILTTITLFILILSFINKKITKILSIYLFSTLLLISFWQGGKFKYKSNLKTEISSNKIKIFDYGENTGFETYSIDSSEYYNGNTGLADWYDHKYWKFTTNLPLNGRVYYPKTLGTYPIIFVIHGNALAEKPSHLGYDYLLKYFAENGYIAVSIDQNFLNGNWTTLGEGLPKENDVRGRLILEHIKLFSDWNKNPNSQLYNKIDIENIGLIGHSRGGEAISIAAKYSTYPIKSLMSLSGTDRQFREHIRLKDISYIALHGANDGDLKTFKARAQFNRIKFTSSGFNLKATYYIEGLNHVQFNTDWGLIDSSSLGKLFYGINNNIHAEDQREIAKQLGLKLFNITLKNIRTDVKYVKQPGEINTMPGVSYITDYLDSDTDNFTNTFIAQHAEIKSIYINSDSVYEIHYKKNNKIILQNGIKNKPIKSIIFSLANKDLRTLNIKVNVSNNNSSKYQTELFLNPGIRKKIFKTDILMGKFDIEPNFQFFEIPMDNINNWDTLELTFHNSDNTGGFVLISDFSYTTSYQKIE